MKNSQDSKNADRACKGATNRKEALQYEAIVKSELMKGNLGIIENKKQPRLKEAVDLYLQYSKTNKKSFKSDLTLTKHIMNFFQNIDLIEITPTLVEDFKQYLANDLNLKNATINRHLEALSKIFNICISNKLIDKNPLQNVKKMKKNNYKIRFLSKDEEKRLFAYLPKYLSDIVICALKTGMRKGEILNLKWGNIDFKVDCIELLNTKSGKKRKIPLSAKLKKVLLQIKENNESEYIFINPRTQKPFSDIKKSFNSAVKNAKIKNFRFHDLRHTFATRLIEKNIDIVVAKELMGHADISTTMIYVHYDADRKKNAINVIDDY